MFQSLLLLIEDHYQEIIKSPWVADEALPGHAILEERR